MKFNPFFIKGFIVILIILLVLFVIGFYFKERCYEIKGCKKCWSIDNETAHYNALIDLILCACQYAKDAEYKDNSLNYEIERIYKEVSRTSGKAEEICRGELPLIKYK